jgi:phosphoenolpyruvate synthase/pyruvate phosphate dikinase
MMLEILWLGDSDCHDINKVGAKAANLSRLAASQHPVPPGFCIPAEAYSQWVELTSSGPSTTSTRFFPTPIYYEELVLAYNRLAAYCSTLNPRVAVRSSAVDEDGAAASFAGQYETYLNIVGADTVAEAIASCWASARTDRALEYYQRHKISPDGIRLSVLVQQLVPADTSAVVFSANPLTGSHDEVMINASWGLGESLVGGMVTPDTYVVRKSDLAVVSRNIADKQRMTVLAHQGTQEAPVPRQQRNIPAIDDGQATEMARLSITLESVMGWPVDIECAYQEGKLYLLQCRPITTLGLFEVAKSSGIAQSNPDVSSEERSLHHDDASSSYRVSSFARY